MQNITLMIIFLCSILCGQTLRVGFWNVENLFDLVDDPLTNDEEFAVGGKKNVNREIYDLKMKNCALVLRDLNADVVGLCEVENFQVLKELEQIYAERDYRIVHFDSPDERGIDNALLYDPDQFKILESKAIRNVLPSGSPTRDILYVAGKYKKVILHIFVNHWPSNYGGKEESIPERRATARLLANEISKILSQDPRAEILCLGDFNENPTDENVQILQSVNMTSLMTKMMGTPHVGTYVYRGEDLFFDQLIVSAGLQDHQGLTVVEGFILDKPAYRQQEGKYAHYPFRFWAGDQLLGGYSDHLPVYVQITKK